MKRERTENYDVFRLADSISIVERRSGVAVVSFALPSEEVRDALIRLLSDPVKKEPAEKAPAPSESSEPGPATDPAPAPDAEAPEKKTTKKRTTKKDATT